jgi:hypothetical protein
MSDPTLDATPTTSLKPGDQVIYILGRIEGTVSSLKGSVESSNQSQALVNSANELEHQEFRKTLGIHATAIAGFTQDRVDAKSNKLSGLQVVGLWIAAIGGLSGVGTLIFFINQN